MYEDGRTFVEGADAYYDVVIIDVVDMLDEEVFGTLGFISLELRRKAAYSKALT